MRLSVAFPKLKHKTDTVSASSTDSRIDDFGFGGMLSIDLVSSERASRFMELMEMHDVGYLAVSLGYFKTLFSNSGKSTSSEVPEEVQHDMGLSDGLVRFSVGLDHNIEHTWKSIEKCLKMME